MGCSKEAPHLSKETLWNPRGRELSAPTAGAGGEARLPPRVRSLGSSPAAVGWGRRLSPSQGLLQTKVGG